MFDFAKTVVCGVGKSVVGTLAVIGGCFVAAVFVNDKFAEGVGKAVRDGLEEVEAS